MKRRICCFCEAWESGGIESFLNNVLLHMDLSNEEVDVVAACVKPSVFSAKLEAKGVRFVQLSGKLRSPANFQIFRKLVCERRYDVIHFNLFQGLALYYVQIAKACGVPIRIAHSHGSGLRNSKTKLLKMLLHKVGKKLWGGAATECWACSKPAAEFLFDSRTYCFVPNGIDVEKFRFCDSARRKVREELGLSEKTVIGAVGRLSQEKNHRFLLDVFREYRLTDPQSVLLLVGDGDKKEALVEQAKTLGIVESVIFYGTSPCVNELLSAMDIFVFPSIFEGLGIAAIEAQASGLPVLCSDGVPLETHIISSLRALPLADGESRWAAELARMLHAHPQRGPCADAVRNAGFDVTTVSRFVSEKYEL